MKDNLSELQKTQAAYAHFTLDEWRLLAQCLWQTRGEYEGTRFALDPDAVADILVKFPSAALE